MLLISVYAPGVLGILASGCHDNDSLEPVVPAIFNFLLDPTLGTGYQFGSTVIILANGNIVVAEPEKNSVASDNGAVHLFNPANQYRVASLLGDNTND